MKYSKLHPITQSFFLEHYGYEYGEENVEEMEELFKNQLQQVDNKKVHDTIRFPLAWVDLDNDFLFINALNYNDAQRLIYYVGGENTATLVFFYDGFYVYSNCSSRFQNKLVDDNENETEEV